jgi:hypothetical protein
MAASPSTLLTHSLCTWHWVITLSPPSHLWIIFMKSWWVPCHHSMARPQVADGGNTLQVWRVAANILNKQSRTADKRWSSSLGVGRGANNSSP